MREFYVYAFMSVIPVVAWAEEPMQIDARCGQVVVMCHINERPMQMLLDTGAGHTMLHKAAAAKLPNLKKGAKVQIKPMGNSEKPSESAVVSISIGGKSFAEQPVLVSDLKALHAIMQKRVDGVLGMDVLRHLDFTLDIANGTLRWGCPEDEADLQPLPGQYNELGLFETEMSIAEKKLVFLLDTGVSQSQMPLADWPYDRENECAVQIADINTARDQEMADGCPTDIAWPASMTMKGFSPMLSSVCTRPLLGVDALRHLKLVHKAATEEHPHGQFMVQESAASNK